MRILIHPEVLNDIKKCHKKWYKSLGTELPRICRLLNQEGQLPGQRHVHYIKEALLQHKVFHAGVNLPQERVGKKQGARIIYVKESVDLIKVIYVGGHKDKRYDDSYMQVELIEERYLYPTEGYEVFDDMFEFNYSEAEQ